MTASDPTPAVQRSAALGPRRRRAHRPLSRRKRLAFGGVAIVGFFLLLEAVLALAGVKPRSGAEDPYVGFAGPSRLFVEVQRAGQGTLLETAPNKRRLFNPQSFPREKRPGVRRIFCVGGSTTYGHPYDDRVSFCGWLREFLNAADTSQEWEVINAGGISYASYREARLMEELAEYEPDLFIICTGHNEFLERRTYAGVIATPEAVRGLGAALAGTRTMTALRGVLQRVRANDKGAPPRRPDLPAEVRAQLDTVVGLDAYHRDAEFQRQALAHFSYNLRRMVRIADDAGARVIFVAAGSNLADCAPFKSEHRAGLPADEAATWERLFSQADEQHRGGRFAEALVLVDEALKIDGAYAAAHYLRGRCLLALERFPAAQEALVRARDEDVCPLRALTPMRGTLLEAARETGARVVDFEQMVAERAEHGIPGREQFLDHVHPTIEETGRLALALLEAMTGEGLAAPGADWGPEAIAAVTQRVESGVDRRYRALGLRNLSKTLGWAGKLDEADTLALAAVELDPEDAEAQYQAGNALYRRGDFRAAESHFERSLAISPAQSQAHYGLGLVHAELGDAQRAIAAYQAALRHDRDFSDAHFNLALLLEHHGDPQEAATHYRAVLRVHPDDAVTHNCLGVVLARLGRRDEARQEFDAALRLRPDLVAARDNLQRLDREQGRTGDAARRTHATD